MLKTSCCARLCMGGYSCNGMVTQTAAGAYNSAVFCLKLPLTCWPSSRQRRRERWRNIAWYLLPRPPFSSLPQSSGSRQRGLARRGRRARTCIAWRKRLDVARQRAGWFCSLVRAFPHRAPLPAHAYLSSLPTSFSRAACGPLTRLRRRAITLLLVCGCA